MPLYEYYCQECKNKFELLSTFSHADSDVICQKCHGSKVRRMLSVFSARRGGDGEFNDGGHYAQANDAIGGMGGGCSCGGGGCGCSDLAN